MTRNYTKQPTVDTQDAPASDIPSIAVPKTGSFTAADIPEIEVTHDTMAEKSDWARDMAFLSEPIQIRIHGTTDPNLEQRIYVSVNNERSHPQYGNYLPRDTELWIKRQVAEALLRAKPIAVKTVQTKDYDGSDTARIDRSTGNAYPFEVINPTEKDRAWIKRIRAEV